MEYHGIKITVRRVYNGAYYDEEPKDWLRDRIEKTLPFLNPNQIHVRLVCHDAPGAVLTFGECAPCNGGYVIDVDRS